MTPAPPTLEVRHRPQAIAGQEDLDAARAGFDALRHRPAAVLQVGRCRPTAAFSRRDLLLPAIEAAQAAASGLGYEPAVRHVGGRLAAYDEGSVTVHAWAAHHDPRIDLRRRFAVLSEGLRTALDGLGVPDVRIGAVPGEYCEGEWSLNAAGRSKVAGTGQRLSRWGWTWSAVLTISRTPALRETLVECYRTLGLDLDPATIGCLDDERPGLGWDEVAQAVADVLARVLREELL